ncbi:MAG: hypothetical protein ACRCS9_15725 [Hyphomicrobium sp.]
MTTIQHNHDFKPCVQGAFGGGLTRALFFDGMVLSATDLLREQSYWRMKRKLTNRALGEGVVWGLTTEWNDKTRTFTVCPGYGLSCCGDDLIVECPETVGEGQLVDPCSEDFRALLADKFDKCDECARPDTPVPAALMLEYVECPEDPRSTYEDPCAETARGCRFGAVRETVRLRLVPPPEECAGPLDRFCHKIKELRAELLAAGSPMPEPDFNPFKPESRFGFAFLLADGSVIDGASQRVELKMGETETAGPRSSGTAAQLRLFIEPPDGSVFTKVEVDNVDKSDAATVLGWSQDHAMTAVATGAANHTVVVQTSSLFGSGSDLKVTYRITTAQSNVGLQTTITIEAVEALATRTDCASLLAGKWLTDGDALCRAKALALALIYSVAAGKLASANCGESELTEAEEKARKAIAWALCWIGWKALYGIDINDTKAAKIQNCLRALFVEWCEGFAYKGPRCCATSHGVYLGGVELSPKGKILCFDPWRYRRYVLTGPLITHWGSLFGLPPLDGVASRVASWICCVAKADVGTAPAVLAAAGDLIAPLGSGAALAIGPSFATSPKIVGATASHQTIDPIKLAMRLGEALFDRSGSSIATAPTVTVASVANAPVQLVTRSAQASVAAYSAAPAAAAEAVKQEVQALVVAVPAMARAPMRDYVANLAEIIPVTALKAESDSPTFEPMLAALERANVRSIAELASAGPEVAADRVRPLLAESPEFRDAVSVDKAMGLVYDRTLKLLGETGEAIAAEARNREADEPFTRADLPDAVSDVQRAANQFLKKGKGTTLAALRDVAARTMAARP